MLLRSILKRIQMQGKLQTQQPERKKELNEYREDKPASFFYPILWSYNLNFFFKKSGI